jgi:hypothetical protein
VVDLGTNPPGDGPEDEPVGHTAEDAPLPPEGEPVHVAMRRRRRKG